MNRTIDHRNLTMLLLEAREALVGRFRPILKEASLTEQQWRIIRLLDGEPRGELEAGQIAKRCCILSPSLTGVLERLERDGLITRMRSTEDQRRLLVALTERSRQLARKIGQRIDDQDRQLEQQLGADGLRAIYTALDRLLEVASVH
ncbi:homoprotocatechuate degradation operon regulator HpaR [Burkholderia glumae]|uniref:Homoprotocatechuate degradation operon regulator HpaR n=1 Tax=Burkholderia glumae TaxID=337 RepID=A0AAP9XXW9_BURGL|nr:homoprotocatechuate degradation operon regulator HpaR [Burkholderia glumae]ACR32129.1 MarR family transcriptional regulator [Burkholderia glumae BGR1]AJY63524.1 homoprotocatechuate degradation operon regulator, HpaR [Burkholderia glumae LMG 2196 = ATCC 33617]PNL05602.1 homoprotocatechuate degradation operon regulator HpaR [Burkholderia glumae]QPQ89462.1 homoprotocatechuate degradation operon regulator HpaR [Burkholderia glumae]QQM93295.1 homoprotocatechuate degradation operon regulator HpaR